MFDRRAAMLVQGVLGVHVGLSIALPVAVAAGASTPVLLGLTAAVWVLPTVVLVGLAREAPKEAHRLAVIQVAADFKRLRHGT